MNPRIQVEHTVTEQVTGRDLVIAQLRIAAGMTLPEMDLQQEQIHVDGAALQCRVTTEDPANGFRPDTGVISAYRSPGGPGVRLDGGTHVAAEVSAHFDSMLVKLTCNSHTFANAVRRARRAVAEFRIRGVATNLPFLAAVLDDPDFRAGRVTTSFIDERPHLLDARRPADRGTRILTYLAETTVNKPNGPRPAVVEPVDKLPSGILHVPVVDGSRQQLAALGPEGFAARLRAQDAVAVTDTTFRDAHQSLLATRVRTRDLVAVAPHVARLAPELLSLECWGGATYDVALRFLAEDPWERLAALRAAVPNICTQMLLRGRNTVGYTPYPTEVTDAFVAEAAATGMDIFRIFDALNDVEQMRPAIDAVRATGTAVAEVALCYTGDLSDPAERLYTLDYYLRLAERIVDGRRARAGDQGHGRAAAPARGADAGHGAARAVRPARAPAHPRHRGRPARHPDHGDRRGRGRRGRRRRVDGRHHQPAVAVGAGRGHRPHPAGHRAATARRSRTWSRTGRPCGRSTRRSSRASRRRPAASTPTRSPAGSCPTCGSRRSRSASATGSS